MAIHIRRRAFIAAFGGAAGAFPLAARAQQRARMRRIGVIMSLAANDPEDQARIAALRQGLQEVGWTDGRNARTDRAPGDAERVRTYVVEIPAIARDGRVATRRTPRRGHLNECRGS